MSFEFVPPSGDNLGTDAVYTSINYGIAVTFTPEEEDPENPEYLSSVTISADIEEDSALLNSGTSSCSITGNYTLDLFNNMTISYVDKGFSDKSQTPIIVNKTTLVPENKDVFSAITDPVKTKIITYNVIATTNLGASESATYTYTVGQTYDAIRDWIQSYFGGA